MNIEPYILATRSGDKTREIREIFNAAGHQIVSLDELGVEITPEEDSLEDADSFEENALAKARFFARRLQRAVLADDSGLEVEALGGRPGVLSKRWSGSDLIGRELDEANNSLLVAKLAGERNRRARYVCVAAMICGELALAFPGTTAGSIVEVPRGTNGFGYDPYFLSDELGKTFGEATLEEKQSVSHRGRAFGALLKALQERR